MDANWKPGISQAEFRPELLPLRGEWVAWGGALAALAAWALLLALEITPHPAFELLAVFLLLSVLVIRLGDWVDRRAFIRKEIEQSSKGYYYARQ
ncbi:MAG: hypothetical protein JXA78_14440 [Anaerolineales bacterium]|nr:hypothetical protein [Anaerolineales bacterium]